MTLAPGARLGPYEILAPLGAGGMGEVYRARDSRLGREVAIKVLPARFSVDADRLRRFELEARAAAAIEHPAVVAVYDVGVADGSPYLVTELLSGGNLRELLAGGRPTLQRTREILRALLEGLGEAHARGIVHRDLKPENVFVTRAGRVKLLDFGLAKLLQPDVGATDATLAVTETGQLLGTAGYMSPEQVRGEPVDARADLFAVGVMLYELLTGERAFSGASSVETLHAILNSDPAPVSGRVPGLPPPLDAVVSRCLAKRPEDRFQSAKDLLFAFELASQAPATGGIAPAAARPVSRALPVSMALLVVALGLAAWAFVTTRSRPTEQSSWASGTLTPLTVDPGYEGQATFSPDGETVAYTSDRSGNFELYLQQVGGGSPVNVTQNPADDVQPAFSPDGRDLAFVSARSSRLDLIYRAPGAPMLGGDIWIMPSLGGMARRVIEDGNFPAWSPDGRTIYFVRAKWFRSQLRRVDATGGESTEIPIEFPPGFAAGFVQRPHASPDGRLLLFTTGDQIFCAPVKGGKATPLAVGTDATWDASGKAVLYCNTESGRNSGLWQMAVSADGQPAGPARPLLVGPAGFEALDADRSGKRLVVTTREVSGNLEELGFDAESGVAAKAPTRLTEGRNDISFLTVSPDGQSQIYTNARGASEHLWRLDEGHEPVQLTTDPAWTESYPRWSPDGRLIAFSRRPTGRARQPANGQLWVMAPDGGSPRLITESGGNMAWLPDGRLLYIHLHEFHIVDTGTGKEEPFKVHGPEPMPIFAVSPDARWVVYQSSENRGEVDLAVASIPGGEGRWIVRSDKEDYHPSFSPSGRWLYFQMDHRNIWRVPGPAQDWRAAPPQQVTFMTEPGLFPEDPQVSADGKHLFFSRVQTRGDLWLVELPSARPGKSRP